MRRPRTFADVLAVVFTVSLVAIASACVVVPLWWLIAGDEPDAAEYVELADRHVHGLAFSPDGTKLFADTDDVDQVRWTWELGASSWDDVDTSPGEAPEGGRLTAVAVSPDGTRFATGAEATSRERKVWIFTWDYVYTTGPVHVRKQGTGEVVWQTSVRETGLFDDAYYGDARSLVFSPDGSLLAGDYSGGATFVWDAATGAVRAKLTGGDGRFSPDGRLFALLSSDEVVLWDTATRKVRRTLKAPARTDGRDAGLRAMALSPDGRLVAVGSSDGLVRVWDIATGAVKATMKGNVSSVEALVFSPDGRLVAARMEDRTVRLWETATGAEKAALPRQASSVDALVFSPDGRWLATGSSDGTVRVWESTSWQETRVLRHRERFLLWTTEMGISSIAFSPDGTKLAVASNAKEDGRVALWELS